MDQPHDHSLFIDGVGVPLVTGFRDEPDGSSMEFGAVLTAVGGGSGRHVVLDHGDCLQRPDFVELSSALGASGPFGFATAGPSLRSPQVLDLLTGSGAALPRVTLMGATPAGHDWAAARPREARSILRGVRAAAEAGVAVHVEVALTRACLVGLSECVQMLDALGVRTVGFRAIRVRHVPQQRRIALVGRMGLLRGPVVAAVAESLRRGLGVELRGIPRCVLPVSLGRYAVDTGGGSCAHCEDPRCCGLEPDYVATFGELELRTSPAGECVGTELTWETSESTRVIRMRLVRALEHRGATLRITGTAMHHPQAPALLREAVRSAPRVELAADLAPLLDWTDDEIHRIRKVVLPPGRLAAADEAVQRLAAFGVGS